MQFVAFETPNRRLPMATSPDVSAAAWAARAASYRVKEKRAVGSATGLTDIGLSSPEGAKFRRARETPRSPLANVSNTSFSTPSPGSKIHKLVTPSSQRSRATPRRSPDYKAEVLRLRAELDSTRDQLAAVSASVDDSTRTLQTDLAAMRRETRDSSAMSEVGQLAARVRDLEALLARQEAEADESDGLLGEDEAPCVADAHVSGMAAVLDHIDRLERELGELRASQAAKPPPSPAPKRRRWFALCR